jgi:hypothetical protein
VAGAPIVDPYKIQEFDPYGKGWIPLVEKYGGQHHGYVLPSEGTRNVALAMLSFPSLATYETYRTRSLDDPQCLAAFRYVEDTRYIISYERSFFRPVLGCSVSQRPEDPLEAFTRIKAMAKQFGAGLVGITWLRHLHRGLPLEHTREGAGGAARN